MGSHSSTRGPGSASQPIIVAETPADANKSLLLHLTRLGFRGVCDAFLRAYFQVSGNEVRLRHPCLDTSAKPTAETSQLVLPTTTLTFEDLSQIMAAFPVARGVVASMMGGGCSMQAIEATLREMASSDGAHKELAVVHLDTFQIYIDSSCGARHPRKKRLTSSERAVRLAERTHKEVLQTFTNPDHSKRRRIQSSGSSGSLQCSHSSESLASGASSLQPSEGSMQSDNNLQIVPFSPGTNPPPEEPDGDTIVPLKQNRGKRACATIRRKMEIINYFRNLPPEVTAREKSNHGTFP